MIARGIRAMLIMKWWLLAPFARSSAAQLSFATLGAGVLVAIFSGRRYPGFMVAVSSCAQAIRFTKRHDADRPFERQITQFCIV
jgi:hypothetical protein